MDDYEIVVYATHAKGMFQGLVDNSFGVPITVLGWGEPWKNYRQKSVAIYKHLRQSNSSDKIVILLDGFDTKIVNHPQNAVRKFIELGYSDKVLYSSHFNYDAWNWNLGHFILNVLFLTEFPSSCRHLHLNAGMYMGRVRNILPILEQLIHSKYIDDQKFINKECASFRHQIECDQNMDIFQNIIYTQLSKKIRSNVVFVSYPGLGGSTSMASREYTQRVLRGFTEYRTFTMHLSFILVLAILLNLIYVYRYRNK